MSAWVIFAATLRQSSNANVSTAAVPLASLLFREHASGMISLRHVYCDAEPLPGQPVRGGWWCRLTSVYDRQKKRRGNATWTGWPAGLLQYSSGVCGQPLSADKLAGPNVDQHDLMICTVSSLGLWTAVPTAGVLAIDLGGINEDLPRNPHAPGFFFA